MGTAERRCPGHVRRRGVAAPVLAISVLLGTLLVPGAVDAAQCGWTMVPNVQLDFSWSLRGVDGVASGDVWAVGWTAVGGGAETLIEHWDGTAWTRVASPNPGAYSNELRAVTAISANDVWAVGSYSDEFAGEDFALLEHWDGHAWSALPNPVPGLASPRLDDVSGTSASDIWTVGEAGANGIILHWNGTGWFEVVAPVVEDPWHLTGVSALGPSYAWAVGATDFGEAIIVRWDGSEWALSPTGPSSLVQESLTDVVALSRSKAWAVGWGSTSHGGDTVRPSGERFNGLAWAVRRLPGPTGFLNAIDATSPTDAWAVGTPYAPDNHVSLIEHWDGAAWTATQGPEARSPYLLGVTAISATDVWAVGEALTPALHLNALTEHYHC